MKLGIIMKDIADISDAMSDIEIEFITDNSKKIVKGCAFVCIKGKAVDGHSFAAQAIIDGASVVIVERDLGLENQIIVDDTRKAYTMMFAAFYGNPEKRMKIIGLTGTNGKTTECFLIKDIIEANGNKCGLIGTIKTVIGDEELPAALTTPDANELFMLFRKMVDAGCDYCVMEVSSQALHQQRVAGIEFDAAIFTNLTQDHLDYHENFDAYKAAKKILFKNTKLAIINYDDAEYGYITEGISCKVVSYSAKNDEADFTARQIKLSSKEIEYELVGMGVISRIKFGIPGLFSVYNSMAAAVCCIELGIDISEVSNALRNAGTVSGRMEQVKTDRDFTVIIDYAHTPDALENVLSTLNNIKSGKILTVFGCGGNRDRTKRPLMAEIACKLSDSVFVTSDNPRTENPEGIVNEIMEGTKSSKAAVFKEVDRTRAIELALSKAKKNDIVLIAGKGHELYQIIGTEKIHFDEREIIRDILTRI